MIEWIDVVHGGEGGADFYKVGEDGIEEIKLSEYRINADPYPCFLIVHDNGSTTEIRTVDRCNIRKVPTEKGVDCAHTD